MSRYTLPAAILAAMLLAGSLDAGGGGLNSNLKERTSDGAPKQRTRAVPHVFVAPERVVVQNTPQRRASDRMDTVLLVLGRSALPATRWLARVEPRRTVGYGQIKFDGLGPERWAAKWRKQRREHRRDVKWLKGELAKERPTRSLSSARAPGVDACLDELIERESKWDVHATNPKTGAYGLPQALPGSKMASAGADWRDNPATQIRWMRIYVGKYGGSCGALAFQKANGWY